MQIKTHHIITRYLMSAGIISLGAGLIYLSYAIMYTVKQVPDTFAEIDKAGERIDRVLDEVKLVSDQVPLIIEQVDLLQKKIPSILAEVKENRLLVPGIVKEVEQLRLQVPLILNEVKAIREEMPVILSELEAYRKLVPDVLTEVAAVREIIPPTLDRAERLAQEVRSAGQEASEGAVLGLFSGIIKLPFKMFGGIKEKFETAKLSDSDVDKIRQASINALQANIGTTHKWTNTDSKHSGEVKVVSETSDDGKHCRKLNITVNKNNRQIDSQNTQVCQLDNGEWKLE
ncbi:MAG: RT0821/Lpp0805 family surface protein [Gammaproteobacteria bacterium]|nr:RT0821/Lpp0805 family surface protein [Gammaproteobacteria bacterium]